MRHELWPVGEVMARGCEVIVGLGLIVEIAGHRYISSLVKLYQVPVMQWPGQVPPNSGLAN